MKKAFGMFLYLMSFLLTIGSIFFTTLMFNSGIKNKSFILMFIIIYIILGIGAYYLGKHLQKD